MEKQNQNQSKQQGHGLQGNEQMDQKKQTPGQSGQNKSHKDTKDSAQKQQPNSSQRQGGYSSEQEQQQTNREQTKLHGDEKGKAADKAVYFSKLRQEILNKFSSNSSCYFISGKFVILSKQPAYASLSFIRKNTP